MTRREVCNSMTLQDAIQVFRDTNAYGTMDIAKTVILEALEKQTSDDCIRRADANLTDFEILMCNGDYKEALKMLLDKIEKAPSVTPLTTSQQATAERIIKDTIKEYIGEFYLDTDDLLLTLSKDLCERIRKAN